MIRLVWRFSRVSGVTGKNGHLFHLVRSGCGHDVVKGLCWSAGPGCFDARRNFPRFRASFFELFYVCLLKRDV